MHVSPNECSKISSTMQHSLLTFAYIFTTVKYKKVRLGQVKVLSQHSIREEEKKGALKRSITKAKIILFQKPQKTIKFTPVLINCINFIMHFDIKRSFVNFFHKFKKLYNVGNSDRVFMTTSTS